MVTSCSLFSQSGHGGQLSTNPSGGKVRVFPKSMNGALAVTHAGSEMRHQVADEETQLVLKMLAKKFPQGMDETDVT